jgi:5-methylcytosine-specific restriction protein A
MAITNEMIKQSYIIAKRVYNNELSLNEGKSILNEKFEMNKVSAGIYINNFRCLMTGQQYKRTMNRNATKYYLQNIFDEFGYNSLQTALQAVAYHLSEQERNGYNKLDGIREIYNHFINIQDPKGEKS